MYDKGIQIEIEFFRIIAFNFREYLLQVELFREIDRSYDLFFKIEDFIIQEAIDGDHEERGNHIQFETLHGSQTLFLAVGTVK